MKPINDAFHRLLQFGHTAKILALPVWRAVLRSEAAALQWLKCRPRVVFWSIGIGILGFLIGGGPSWYGKHHAALAPLLTLAAGGSVAAVALIRHFAQTDADRQRRITESFSKAVEQLGSDKLEVRLGGIYSLERISKESPDDYWTVMENLTAFVRERSRRNEAERTSLDLEQRVSRRAYFRWLEAGRPDGIADDLWTLAAREEEIGEPPTTDLATVLTVIKRRSEESREREGANDWRFDLSGAILKRANLPGAHLERASLSDAYLERASLSGAYLELADLHDAHLERADLHGAHLEWAFLRRTYLEGALLSGAYLEGALLSGAHLEGAHLSGAHLEGASLRGAHLEGASLRGAHLEGAFLHDAHLERASLRGAHLADAKLMGVHLEGADLEGATGLSEAQLRDGAHGDAATRLPEGLTRPPNWPVEVT